MTLATLWVAQNFLGLETGWCWFSNLRESGTLVFPRLGTGAFDAPESEQA